MPIKEKSSISHVLNRANKELKLNNNISGDEALFESVREKLVDYPSFTVNPPQPDTGPAIANPQISRSPLPFPALSLILPLILLFSIPGVFGMLWYRNRKVN
jgi:hypothetical protein